MSNLTKIETAAKRLIAEVKKLPSGETCFSCDRDVPIYKLWECHRCNKRELPQCEECATRRCYVAELCTNCRTCMSCKKPIDTTVLMNSSLLTLSQYRDRVCEGRWALCCKACK